MRATGNGNPAICTENLLKIVRGEVPFERLKGMDPRIIDRPIIEAEAELQQNAQWLISTYEPRVTINRIQIAQSDGLDGGFAITAQVKRKEV